MADVPQQGRTIGETPREMFTALHGVAAADRAANAATARASAAAVHGNGDSWGGYMTKVVDVAQSGMQRQSAMGHGLSSGKGNTAPVGSVSGVVAAARPLAARSNGGVPPSPVIDVDEDCRPNPPRPAAPIVGTSRTPASRFRGTENSSRKHNMMHRRSSPPHSTRQVKNPAAVNFRWQAEDLFDVGFDIDEFEDKPDNKKLRVTWTTSNKKKLVRQVRKRGFMF